MVVASNNDHRDVNVTESTDGTERVDFCTDTVPTTAVLFSYMPVEGHVLMAILVLFSVLTLFVYLDQVRFIRKNIRNGNRTMWVLACYPVFSWTALLGVLMPRSGVVIDMIANGFFATCLYNFGRLMIRYMGGTSRLWRVFDSGRIVTFNTPPICCCCLCLPRPPFSMRVYNSMRMMVMQVAIARPILTFLAVVLWADGTFKPGTMSFRNPHTYIGVANVISTMTAVYGLMLLRNAFKVELEKHFLITGKIMAVQLALVCSILPNIIIGILVATNVIKCGPIFPSKARGEAICHAVIVLIMLPLGLLAQTFFRRASDSDAYPDRKLSTMVADGDGTGTAHPESTAMMPVNMMSVNEWTPASEDGLVNGGETKV